MGGQTRAPLLARDRELARCSAALDALLSGRGSAIVVEGPIGIGKSAILRSVGADAARRDFRVLTARATEMESELDFSAARQLFDPVLRSAGAADDTRVFEGPSALAKHALRRESAGLRDRTHDVAPIVDAVHAVLTRVAESRPVVALIDDAHWVDVPTLRLVDFTLPRIGRQPILVVLASRPVRTGRGFDSATEGLLGRILADPVAEVLHPAPLSNDQVRQWILDEVGSEPDPAFVDACAGVSGGNPWYLTELVRQLLLDGVLPDAAGVPSVHCAAPPGLAAGLRYRGRLSLKAFELARALCVLGDGAWLDHAAALAGLDAVAATDAADELGRESVLSPQPGLFFQHPIVRTALYADLTPRERAAAHRLAAEVLRSSAADPEQVAVHLMQAAPAGDADVVSALRTAARAAMGRGSCDVAAEWLLRALDEPCALAERASLLLELAQAEAAAGREEAIPRFSAAYRAATEADGRAEVAMAAALPMGGAGQVAEAAGMLARSAQELAADDPARGLALKARLLSLALTDPLTARRHAATLEDVDDALAPDSTGARMMLCQLGYQRMWRSKEAAVAVGQVRRALAGAGFLSELGTEAPELNSAALTLICADHLDEAQRLLEEAGTHALTHGSRGGFAHVSFLRSLLAYRRGRLVEAQNEASTTLGIAIGGGLVLAAALASAVQVLVMAEQGRLEDARRTLVARGLDRGRMPEPLPYNLVLSARGRLRIAEGDVLGGLDDLHACGERNESLGVRNGVFVPWRIDAALAHRDLGEVDTARAFAREELEAAQDWGTPGGLGAARRTLGLLAAKDEQLDLLQAAVAALRESPAQLERARAAVDLGASLRRAARRADAREPLEEGLALAEGCGAEVVARRARDELSAMGDHRQGIGSMGASALTPRERRVCLLAAQGLSNSEIANTLFVTTKTVEKHLGNAYAKLGVRSRRQLQASLQWEAVEAHGGAEHTR